MSKKQMVSREHTDILTFVLNCMVPRPEHFMFSEEIFEGYQRWRKKLGLTPSELSVDSFGRLFPKHIKRVSISRAGRTRRGVRGYEVSA
jgi:hypothetical protein